MSPGPNSQSMDATRIPLNIEISCGDDMNSEVGSGKYDPSSYKLISDRDWCDRNVDLTENLRLFTAGTGSLSRQRHAESLHKISTAGGGASRNIIVNEPRNFPLTKGYLNAANRHLAASTLKLWQGGSGNSIAAKPNFNRSRRMSRSVFDLNGMYGGMV